MQTVLRSTPRPGSGSVTGLLVTFTALALGACGGGSDPAPNVSFVVRTSPHAVSTGLVPIVDGGWLAYLAREFDTGPGGTDLNGNGVKADDVPVVVEMGTQAMTVMTEAAANDQLELWNGHLWFVADESIEAADLNLDADQTDTLLMHWTAGLTAAEVVTDLDTTTGGKWMQWSEDKLYFPRANFTPTGDETTLAFVTAAAPTAAVVVENQAAGGTLQPRILGAADGLLFLFLDETLEGQNLNAAGPGSDVDSTDTHVLALIDLGVPAVPLVKNTGVALADASAPFTAVEVNGNDHVVAFLVDEAAQGPADLNDPALFDAAWRLSQCSLTADGDTTDQILFTLPYQAWLAGVTTDPINTGLAGADRVLAMNGYVGTLVPELDAGCDINVDADTSDRIFRWTSTNLPIIPPDATTDLHAVATLPGDSEGIAVFDGNWVIAVDEMLDSKILNNDGLMDDVLLAHIAPTGATNWQFTQASFPPSSPTFSVGVDWMAAEPQSGALPVSFQESVWGATLNVEISNPPYDDGDSVDVLPTWTEFDGSVLRVFRLRWAARTGNPGTVVTPTWVFARISESEHGKQFNESGAGDLNDVILFRIARAGGVPVAMSTASDESGPVVHTRDGAVGAAFVASEQQASVDLNGDGDAVPNDLVVRWFVY